MPNMDVRGTQTMRRFLTKGRAYAVICGIIVGFLFAQLFFNVPIRDRSAVALPGYVLAVLIVAFLLKVVLERVQRANARRFGEAIAQRNRCQQLLGRLIRAQEDERKRLSLDLHDSPVQWLTSCVYRLEAALSFFARGDYGRAREELAKIEGVLDTTLRELRSTAAALHPPELEKVGLASALARHANVFEKDTGIKCDFGQIGLVPRLEAPAELAVYRVVQEALSNVRKHSGATCASIQIGLRSGAMIASIRDDGLGFDPDDCRGVGSSHLGIAGMEERARMLGGGLSIQSVPRAGSQVVLSIPLTENRAKVDARKEVYELAQQAHIAFPGSVDG